MSNYVNAYIVNRLKLQLALLDSQNNLEEFTLMMTKNIDFSTFDVLSITRADVQPSITHQIAHRKVDTQSARVAHQDAKIIPLIGHKIG